MILLISRFFCSVFFCCFKIHIYIYIHKRCIALTRTSSLQLCMKYQTNFVVHCFASDLSSNLLFFEQILIFNGYMAHLQIIKTFKKKKNWMVQRVFLFSSICCVFFCNICTFIYIIRLISMFKTLHFAFAFAFVGFDLIFFSFYNLIVTFILCIELNLVKRSQ